jgi:putative spermidine/putrescine transport system substrate-binding protein
VPPKDVYKCWRGRRRGRSRLKKLDSIKKDLIFGKAGAQPPQHLASGEVVMTSVYTVASTPPTRPTSATSASSGTAPVHHRFLGDPEGSPNVASAYKYLNFVGKPATRRS